MAAKKTSLLVRECQKRKRDLIRRYKASIGCACGEKDPLALDLHHLDPESKHWMLRTYMTEEGKRWRPTWGNMSFADIVSEIRQCVVICSNCHRKHERRNDPPPAFSKKSSAYEKAERELGLR